MFVVFALRKVADAVVGPYGFEVSMELKWAEGQIGALPVFGTREDAESFADGKAEVYEVRGS